MDIDFHYYATFAAARTAGYSEDDAVTIAHAAQYVDDSSLQRLVFQYPGVAVLGVNFNYKITDFTPIPTVHTNAELLQMETRLGWPTSDLNKLRRVWSVFHFLPANYEGSFAVVEEYGGPKEWKAGELSVYEYGEEDAIDFKLMCLPKSRLLEEIINDTVLKPHTEKGKLHLAGIRMHVLADTWAHCYYAGTPNYWLNDAWHDVYEVDSADNPGSRISWKGHEFGDEWAITPSLYVKSTCYLGHGRMGHLPDYPWMKYQYRPQWAKKPLIKDNPADYLKGFSQMVAALRCIRLGQEFSVATTCQVSSEVEEKIGKIISLTSGITEPEKRCDIWLKNLENLEMNGVKVGVPPVYDPNHWQNEARGNYNDINSNYYLFNLSARKHHDLVIRNLEKHTGVDLNQENHGFMDWTKEILNNSPAQKIKDELIYFGDEVVDEVVNTYKKLKGLFS